MARRRVPKKVLNVIREYTKRLRQEERIPIERTILFGSQARGRTRKWSDIDVCLTSPKFEDPFEALQLLWRKRNHEEVMAGLEPIGFTPKDFREGDSFINEIKRTGISVR